MSIFSYQLGNIFLKVVLFISLIGFLELHCLICFFNYCMYIFNLYGKMIVKLEKKTEINHDQRLGVSRVS